MEFAWSGGRNPYERRTAIVGTGEWDSTLRPAASHTDLHIHYGSEADMATSPRDGLFTPKADIHSRE
jgi:hypothetical protein